MFQGYTPSKFPSISISNFSWLAPNTSTAMFLAK